MFFLRAGGVSLPDGRYEARGERVLGEPEQQACLADALVRASEKKKFRRESTSQSWLPARAKLTKPPGSFGLFAPHPLQQSVLVRPPSRACPVRACVRCMNIILTRVPDDQELDDVVIVLPLARHNFFFFLSSLLPLFSCSNQAVLCWVPLSLFPLHHHTKLASTPERPSFRSLRFCWASRAQSRPWVALALSRPGPVRSLTHAARVDPRLSPLRLGTTTKGGEKLDNISIITNPEGSIRLESQPQPQNTQAGRQPSGQQILSVRAPGGQGGERRG